MTEGGKSGWVLRLREWLASRNLVGGAIVAGAGPVLAAVLPLTSGLWKVVLVVVGVLVALTGYAVPAARAKSTEERAHDAEAEADAAGTRMRLAMSDTLLPGISQVVSGLDPRSDDTPAEVVAATLETVLLSAVGLCDPTGRSRTRACWYRLERNADPVPTFVPKRHHGRGVQPSTRFPTDTPRGRALTELLVEEKYELWDDIDVRKPDSWVPTGNDTSYRSFIVVPVRTGSRPFGLLMVDSAEPNAFTEADVSVVRLLGWTLALAMSQQENVVLPVQSGVTEG